jgi:ABC-type branched-subunit amino acid transport system substrate-binding protein
VAGLAFLLSCSPGTGPEPRTVPAQVQAPDTGVYARTPRELRPYGRFEEAYKTFFLNELEYPGYGRHIPEPDNVSAVKIGFVGPIIGSVSESLGGPKEVILRVNERQTRWDGYTASYLAPIGIKMLQGARLAVAQANARGGFRGKTPFQLVVRNDNGNWRASGREVIMLAYQDSVWAILGTVDGANTHIAIRAALKAEVPVINTADTDPTLVETNIPWVFRNITDDRQMSYLLAEFAFGTLGLRRVAALRAVNRYGRVNIDEFRDAATRLGQPLIAELSYEEGDTLFASQLQQIRELGADAVFTFGNSRESALILKQMRAMGMDQWFLGSDRMVTREFIDIVGPGHGKVAAGPFGVFGGVEHHLLGEKPVEERDARHRQRRDRADHEGDRHQMPQAAQTLDVPGVGLVIDDARGHEQRRLEGRVVDDVEHGGHGGKLGAKAQQHGDQTQMRDG